jgi:hypothetical protein
MSEGYYFIMTHTTGYPMLQAKLWPNPNNGVFRVMVSGIKSGPVSLSVINALGVKVHEKRFAFSSTVGELFVETDALPPGVYMVMVEAREGICGLKMVVE